MKTRLLIIIGIFTSIIAGIPNSDAFFEDGIVVELPLQTIGIEKINDMWYYVSEPFSFESLVDTITFQNIAFSPLYTNVPPRYIYSDVIFPDEIKETLSVLLFEYPDFTEHVEPQAGLVQRDDGYHLLVSMNLKELSPSKQFKSGVPTDEIQCKESLIRMAKHAGSPACVKPETVSKLVTREWGTSDNWIKLSNADKSIHYELDGAKITSIEAFSEYKNPSLPGEIKQTWLQIAVESKLEANLQIILPRDLIDSKVGSMDDGFFVLLDGIETEYRETKTESERTLNFTIPAKIDIVEIIGYGYYNHDLDELTHTSLTEFDKKCSIEKPGSAWDDDEKLCIYTNHVTTEFPHISSLAPENKLQIRHSAGYTAVHITLSSWDEYYEWEKNRGTEHDAMPPLIIDDSNIHPIVFDLLDEMWTFEDYDVSKHDDTLFVKTVQKDYSVPNHHGIKDWLESEYAKQFGASNDGYSHYFEYQDNVYTVIMVAYD